MNFVSFRNGYGSILATECSTMNDSHWIAQLHRFGLIRPSFVPEGEFQRMRLISRHRTNLTEDLARVKNRVQRVLEDGNVKWGVIASSDDLFGARSEGRTIGYRGPVKRAP